MYRAEKNAKDNDSEDAELLLDEMTITRVISYAFYRTPRLLKIGHDTSSFLIMMNKIRCNYCVSREKLDAVAQNSNSLMHRLEKVVYKIKDRLGGRKRR